MRVNLRYLPYPKTENSVNIGPLYGGLNLKDIPSEVAQSQSPDMLNMWYRDGALRTRDALSAEYDIVLTGNRHTGETVKQMYDGLYNGYNIVVTTGAIVAVKDKTLSDVLSFESGEGGSFIPFEEFLFYKDSRNYIKLYMDGDNVAAKKILYTDSTGQHYSDTYLPVIAINRNPDGTGGDAYQPENCINDEKTVWFDVDDKSKDFVLPVHADSVTKVEVDGEVGQDGVVGGHTYSVLNPEGEKTVVRFDSPIDIDEKYWKVKPYGEGGSNGGNYLKNAKWANGTIPFSSGMGDKPATGVKGDTIHLGDDGKYHPEILNEWTPTANMFHMPDRYTHKKLWEGLEALAQFNLFDSKGNRIKTPDASDSTDGGAQFFVLENGSYFNLFELPSSKKGGLDGQITDDFIDSYNWTTTELVMRNYVLASYTYIDDKWTVYDYRGKQDTGGHYGDHASYTTCNAIVSPPTGSPSRNRWVFGSRQWGSYCPINDIRQDVYLEQYKDEADEDPMKAFLDYLAYCNTSLAYQACIITLNYEYKTFGIELDNLSSDPDKHLIDINQWPCIAWVSEDNDWYRFHMIPGRLYKDRDGINASYLAITGYNPDTKQFSANSHYCVSISKKDRSNYTINDYIEGCGIGYSVENITWSACDMVYTGYWDGFTDEPTGHIVEASPLIKEGGDTAYRDQYADIGKYLARKNGMTVSDDDIVVVSESEDGKYIGVWVFPPDSRITEVAGGTTEFKAVNWSNVVYSKFLKDDIEAKIDTSTPATRSNRVRITYSLANPDALKRIVTAKWGTSYGGSDAITVVLANTEAQPNAVMWSGNGSAGVDPTYFPIDQYNLSGTYQDPINALGKFNGSLIVLHGNHTVRASYSIETITNSGRKFIDLQLSTINPQIGCDVPGSVQLCSNNLVWANKKLGICYLNDTSWANENAILQISENVNGSDQRHGLLYDLQNSQLDCSGDDGKRYYLITNGMMWVWDYSISGVSDGVRGLSWTRHDGFAGVKTMSSVEFEIMIPTLYSDGGLRKFAMYDFRTKEYYISADRELDVPFGHYYTSPTLTFDGYYRLRDVQKLILGVRSVSGGYFTVRYCAERTSNPAHEAEATMLNSHRIEIEKDANRDFTTPVVLRPRAIHIHHFNFRIESGRGDVALENAVVTYTNGGVTK